MDRRQFLKSSAAAATIAGAGSLLPANRANADATSRVVLVRNTDMADDMPSDQFDDLIGQMVSEGVKLLAGNGASLKQAWNQFVSAEDIVGVKVNAIAPPMSSHPAVGKAVADGAELCGIPRNHVVVFDKEDRDLIQSGYTINRTDDGLQCFGTVGSADTDFMGYEERQTIRRDTAYHLSRIVSRHLTAIVNVPVLKDHAYAGMTCALKNHFGCIDNPNQFHKVDHCAPAIVDVNHDPNILNKQRLIICDARAILYNGGPSFKPQFLQPYYALILATDPVALDTIAIEVVDQCRAAADLCKLSDRPNAPVHVARAAQHGLGTNDRSKIDLVVHDMTTAS